MRVYVVVGVYGGVIEDVEVFSKEKDADKFKKEIDESYAEKPENESGCYVCKIK